MTRHDTEAALTRVARRHGWTPQPSNQLDYYGLRFTRPEPQGRTATVRVRVTHRIVDALIEIGGLRRQLTLPSRANIEDMLATPSERTW